MSLTATTNNNETVISTDLTEADRKPKYYHCRNCNGEMRLKIPKNRINHFAHMPKSTCGLSGESITHMEAKNYMYNQYKDNNQYRTVNMEHRLWNDERIGDVVLYPKNTDNNPTVIEIQNSPMKVDEIRERFNDWNKEEHSMLWIITDRVIHPVDDVTKEKVIPKWVRYLHKIYMGRVYVYSNNNIYAVHLDGVSRYNAYVGYEYYLKATRIVDSRIVNSKTLVQTEPKHMEGRRMISRFYDKKYWGVRKEC